MKALITAVALIASIASAQAGERRCGPIGQVVSSLHDAAPCWAAVLWANMDGAGTGSGGGCK